MKVIGTEQEIEWIKEALQNNCEGCPLSALCAGAAKKVLKVKLAEEVVDPDDVEMLEDLIVAAVNEAMDKVDAESASAMSKFTGGMGGQMPGLF